MTNRISNPDDPHVPRLQVSQEFINRLPEGVRQTLSYEVVSDIERNLPPQFTHHTFEDLKMAEML